MKISLGFVVAVLCLTPFAALAEDADYVSVKACKLCHNKKAEGEQLKKWQESHHSKTYELLLGDEAIAVGKRVGLASLPSESAECLRCHVTGYDVEAKAFHPKLKKEDGVQCESCHGPASLHLPAGKKAKMSKDASDIELHQTFPKAENCVKCHNDESPSWNPERFTLKDGKKVGFDFEQAVVEVQHPNPKKK